MLAVNEPFNYMKLYRYKWQVCDSKGMRAKPVLSNLQFNRTEMLFRKEIRKNKLSLQKSKQKSIYFKFQKTIVSLQIEKRLR